MNESNLGTWDQLALFEPHVKWMASAERVRDELCKILSLPSTAASLRQLGALDLLAEVLPEVAALKGLAQTGRHRQHEQLPHVR